MAGLFSLGGGGGGGRGSNNGSHQAAEQQHHHHNSQSTEISPPQTLFWYKQNDDVSTYRGFELWNQQQQQQQHVISHHHNQARPLFHRDLYSSAVALGVGPSSASHEQSPSRSAVMAMAGGGSGTTGISCQDCGNQAKKDCPYMRCRTCCKSRGYECQTHVKSTWVPAAKRRERQQQQLSALHDHHQNRDVSKRPRDGGNNNSKDNPSTSSALVCTTRLPSSAGLEVEQGNFPTIVSSPAEFRCVRVSPLDDVNEQYAYQTAVNIGGHMFKGILYDYGPDSSENGSHYGGGSGGEGSSLAIAGSQPLNLIAATDDVTTASGPGVSSTGALVDPSSSLYNPAPLNTYMAGSSGTQFFPHHPRS